MFLAYRGLVPRVGRDVYVDPSARVIGDVTIEDGVVVLPGTVIRADVAPIRLREGCAIEDCCVLHADTQVPSDVEPGLTVGEGVTVGHGAIVHGALVGDGTLIGMGAIVLAGAVVGRGCLVAAGALVTEGARVPDGSLLVGVPGRVLRPVSDAQRAYLAHANELYRAWGAAALAGELREVTPERL